MAHQLLGGLADRGTALWRAVRRAPVGQGGTISARTMRVSPGKNAAFTRRGGYMTADRGEGTHSRANRCAWALGNAQAGPDHYSVRSGSACRTTTQQNVAFVQQVLCLWANGLRSIDIRTIATFRIASAGFSFPGAAQQPSQGNIARIICAICRSKPMCRSGMWQQINPAPQWAVKLLMSPTCVWGASEHDLQCNTRNDATNLRVHSIEANDLACTQGRCRIASSWLQPAERRSLFRPGDGARAPSCIHSPKTNPPCYGPVSALLRIPLCPGQQGARPAPQPTGSCHGVFGASADGQLRWGWDPNQRAWRL